MARQKSENCLTFVCGSLATIFDPLTGPLGNPNAVINYYVFKISTC